ncbi:MAG: hypothetical protein PVG65_01445 [Candidatus Thorarchaeota archaeon]|jgi:hypothetical protein
MDKADFYVEDEYSMLTWVGTVESLGSPYDIPAFLLNAKNKREFERAVSYYLNEMIEDGIDPADGWPHLWDDSRMTRYSYIFMGNKVYCSMFGDFIFDPIKIRNGGDMLEAVIGIPPIIPAFPNMLIYQAAKDIINSEYVDG